MEEKYFYSIIAEKGVDKIIDLEWTHEKPESYSCYDFGGNMSLFTMYVAKVVSPQYTAIVSDRSNRVNPGNSKMFMIDVEGDYTLITADTPDLAAQYANYEFDPGDQFDMYEVEIDHAIEFSIAQTVIKDWKKFERDNK